MVRSDFGEDDELCRGELRTRDCSQHGPEALLTVGMTLDGRSIRLLPCGLCRD